MSTSPLLFLFLFFIYFARIHVGWRQASKLEVPAHPQHSMRSAMTVCELRFSSGSGSFGMKGNLRNHHRPDVY
jgi:hypothetical protein